MDKISISQAIEVYLLAAQARRLSKYTIADYQATFRKILVFLAQDLPVESINSRTVEKFLAIQNSISKKTLLNFHNSLLALWTWMVKEEQVHVRVPHKGDRLRPKIEVG